MVSEIGVVFPTQSFCFFFCLSNNSEWMLNFIPFEQFFNRNMEFQSNFCDVFILVFAQQIYFEHIGNLLFFRFDNRICYFWLHHLYLKSQHIYMDARNFYKLAKFRYATLIINNSYTIFWIEGNF